MAAMSMSTATQALSSYSKHVLVTGANKGIGKAICKKLLTDHSDVYVYLGSRDKGRGAAAVIDLTSECPGCDDRITALELDVTSDDSVSAAAATVSASGVPLYGLINNAGIGFGRTIDETLATNAYGTKRVSDAFIPLIDKDIGRLVNIASASGPMFVASCPSSLQSLFARQPDDCITWEELEEIMNSNYKGQADYDLTLTLTLVLPTGFLKHSLTSLTLTLTFTLTLTLGIAYGLSKAFVNVLTQQQAKAHPNLKINAVTPGYIATDLTAGMGATNPPEKGTTAPLACLFGDMEGNGRYYGSDAVRSPLDRYRGPGDAPYAP
eukprot:CAMPEP_0182600808 /NCGR_PEP_ID=MMETSP1324-20130603/91168_1 /TAXON_ID=236786 /ORGANISM="Florenciella sp., Strain RCC1587" /LENGTH=322 /DNA_ID=CAMNT_0024818717 /DNA_START=15 /DNA_END=984 /DNA_ORIENTATION=-